MNSTRPIATDDPVASFVSHSVCWSVYNTVALCKTAERIEVLLGLETLGAPKHIVLHWSPEVIWLFPLWRRGQSGGQATVYQQDCGGLFTHGHCAVDNGA